MKKVRFVILLFPFEAFSAISDWSYTLFIIGCAGQSSACAMMVMIQ